MDDELPLPIRQMLRPGLSEEVRSWERTARVWRRVAEVGAVATFLTWGFVFWLGIASLEPWCSLCFYYPLVIPPTAALLGFGPAAIAATTWVEARIRALGFIPQSKGVGVALLVLSLVRTGVFMLSLLGG